MADSQKQSADVVQNMLEIINLSVDIGGNRLVSDISLTLQAGETLVVVGPNGAGKSSLLKAVSGEIEPTQGEIRLGEKKLRDWPLQQLACMRAMLTQTSLLNFPFSVEEVVALGRSPHAAGKRVDEAIVNQLLVDLDIKHLQHRFYTQLSGGEKQRTQLARVIAQIWRKQDAEQRLLILDEPTAALDLGHQQQLLHFLKRLAAEGIAIILVVHDLNTAAKIADKVLLLCCGKAMACGSPESVFKEALLEKVFGAKVQVLRHPQTDELLILS